MRTCLSSSLLILLGSTTLLRSGLPAETFTSLETKVRLIELFTSEGCSSCPPADRWLSKLKDSPDFWSKFVPLAFHVDYWDSIGWKDPFASRGNSERQRSYARNGAGRVYTPAFFLNGKEWRGFFRGERLSPEETEKIGILSAEGKGDGRFNVTFSPLRSKNESYVLNAALLGFGLKSSVDRGENRGRLLEHDFVVLRLQKTRMKGSHLGYWTDVYLEPPLETEVTKYATAFWISREESLEPLQATGGFID